MSDLTNYDIAVRVDEMTARILAHKHKVKPEDIVGLKFTEFEVQPDSSLGGRARCKVEYRIEGTYEYSFGLHPTAR